MKLIDFVDGLEDRLVSDNFLGSIDPEIDPLFEFHEVGLVAREHHQVVNFLAFLGVEVLACPPDLHIVQLGHQVSQPIIEELYQQLGVLINREGLHLFDVDLMIACRYLQFLVIGRIDGVDVEATDDWVA